jgi:hypothetical protein
MTQQEMTAHLNALGLRRSYRPYAEPETGILLLQTRKPAQVIDGKLHGSEIALTPGGVFRVWTAQTRKAAKLAQAHRLRLRKLDGEAELFVPANLADAILPIFGAKVKRASRPMTEAQRAALLAHSFGSARVKTGVPEAFHEAC